MSAKKIFLIFFCLFLSLSQKIFACSSPIKFKNCELEFFFLLPRDVLLSDFSEESFRICKENLYAAEFEKRIQKINRLLNEILVLEKQEKIDHQLIEKKIDEISELLFINLSTEDLSFAERIRKKIFFPQQIGAMETWKAIGRSLAKKAWEKRLEDQD
tara:strand:+ start:95 stop:568 length:474 start_codon:yes stop_codon:yes gene_type:complete